MLNFGEKVVFKSKCTLAKLILSFTILLLNGYQVKAVYLMQGQEATLHFPYPCDSTEVTLQHSHRVPFYRSTDGSTLSLPDEQVHRFKVQNRNKNGNCSLDLTISNLMRSDAGTYLSTIYKDGLLLDDYTTWVGLQVDYPPGKASCVMSEEKGEDWVSIDCTANVGSVSGKIECYQDGVWMPPLTDPTETDKTLKQKINITTNQPVFCCSSPLPGYIERCECHDTALYLDDASSSDPCPTVSTKTSTTSTYRAPYLVNNSQSSNSSNYPLPSQTTSTNADKMPKHNLPAIIVIILATFGVIMQIWSEISLHLSIQERKNKSNDVSQHFKAIILCYISTTGLVILTILEAILFFIFQLRQESTNNSNDESQNLETIMIISATGIVILYIINFIYFYQIDQAMQKCKINSNDESQDPSLSRNVHYHYAQKCETEKLNQIMMQELATHKTQNIV